MVGLDKTAPLGALLEHLVTAAAVNNNMLQNPAMSLENYTWIISRLDRALADKNWSTRSDKAAKNEIHAPITSALLPPPNPRKRKPQDIIEEREKIAKRARTVMEQPSDGSDDDEDDEDFADVFDEQWAALNEQDLI